MADIDNDTNQDQNGDEIDDDCEDLEARVEELENNWKRALADYKNLEKRVSEEKEAWALFSNSVLISKLLPFLDNLEMLEKHIDDVGLKLTVKDFRQTLFDEGVSLIEVEGKAFDPDTMDAVEKVDGEEGRVVEVVQKGYKFKNKVLRPARVKVGGNKEENING